MPKRLKLWSGVAVMLGAWAASAQVSQAQPAAEKKSFKLREKVHLIFPREKLIARGLTPPEIPDDQNAAWIYLDAMNAAVGLPDDLQEAHDAAIASGKWPEGETGQRLSEWLDKNADAIELTRKAGAMPQYYMPLAYDGNSDALVAALLPAMGHLRGLAKTMTLSAARARSEGEPDAAIDDAISVQRLGHHAAQGNTLIEGLVGTAIGGLAEKSLRWSIEDGKLSAEKLTAVGAELDKLVASQPDWEKMVRAEEKLSDGHIDDVFDMAGTFPGMLNPYSVIENGSNASPSGWQLLARKLRRLYLPDRLMKKHARSYYDRLVRAEREEKRSGARRPTDEELLQAVPVWNRIGRIMLPSISRACDHTRLRNANFERTRVAVALAAYKGARDKYPTSLAELMPKYLPNVPTDPLTGREMEYVASADGKSHSGLEPVDGDKAKAYYERRNAQATARRNEATHPWRMLVKEYTDRYQFDEAQRTAADAIVRELDARAAAYAKSLAANAKADPSAEHEMTTELTRRLNDLPTAAQRAAAKK